MNELKRIDLSHKITKLRYIEELTFLVNEVLKAPLKRIYIKKVNKRLKKDHD